MRSNYPLTKYVIGLTIVLLGSSGGAEAARFEIVYAFQGDPDGQYPSGLAADKNGNIFGTTLTGGKHDLGTAFRIAPDGSETILYSFRGRDDGSEPVSGVSIDSSGNLYGTTTKGGVSGCNDEGCGTVFRIAPGGGEKIVHAFAETNDGIFPWAAPIKASGVLYGTTQKGGANCPGDDPGCGAIYRIAKDGSETLLYSFCAQPRCSDGAYPYAGLLADKAGNLFGTTAQGGARGYNGVVFKLSPDGTETALHIFQARRNGRQPQAALIADAEGNLYGTTQFGGAADEGTAFRISANGKDRVLYSFMGENDGAAPVGSLLVDAAGNLYGTTYYGGSNACAAGCGTVFKIAPDGTETVLHTFTGGSGGQGAGAGLIALNGWFYGTTETGGANGCSGGCGIVFRIKE